ncbi:hypothetical protein ACP275_11G028600 [Erythranthe tilingii]
MAAPWLEFRCGLNGIIGAVVLRQPSGYSAQILLYGGQVISWKNARGEELLFASERANWEATPNTIRAGIPICFPKFYDYGGLEDHGFARTLLWRLDNLANDSVELPPTNGSAFVDLILDRMPPDFVNWPQHRFELRLRVLLGPTGDLTMLARVRNVNTNGNPVTFKFSFHTYLSVSNIRATHIEGLERTEYLDYLRNRRRYTEGANPITFRNEVDRAYLNTRNVITVTDRQRRRTITIHKNAYLPEVVVYNPWHDARMIPDMGDEEYRRMVCVQAAAVESEITVHPSYEWSGYQRLSVRDY